MWMWWFERCFNPGAMCWAHGVGFGLVGNDFGALFAFALGFLLVVVSGSPFCACIVPMTQLDRFSQLLTAGNDLTAEQTATAARELTLESVADSSKQAFLLALAEKGETATEVAAFAATFRELAIDPGLGELADSAIDIVGTGGDGAGTFNISTAVSFVVAAAGVTVLKHGNRSITSKCGSADILEAVGIRLDAPHEVLQASARELNYCFFFAPAFHPAFKAIMPVRKALAAQGKRTIFNLLGPLINPGKPAHQLLGVYSPDWVQPLGQALDALELESALVVHGRPLPEQGLDELSCAGDNVVAGAGRLRGVEGHLDFEAAGLARCTFAELSGGDAAENLALMQRLVAGDAEGVPSGLRDTILLNAGAAFWVAGRAADLASGVAVARETLDSGAVVKWLQRVQAFYAQG